MNKRSVSLVGLLSVLVACGKSTPAAPTPSPVAVATPTPAPSPVPTPTPVPTHTPCPDCEAPVTNSNPAVRVSIRLYVVEDPGGGYISNPSPDDIPVGWTARLDVTSKDLDNRETTGQGPVEFFFSDPKIVSVTGNHTNQRRVQGLARGPVDCWATQDGVRSNIVSLYFN